jgi:hypothetical protein
MKTTAAEILREYGPFPNVDRVAGVTFDGQHVWFASGDKLNALDPATGKTLRSIDVAAHAAAPARDSRGLKGRSGWGSIEIGRSIKSIPTPERFFAPSSPIVLSPGSLGSTANSGTPPGKATRAICGVSILKRERSLKSSICRLE